jgi:hypothetical protein
MCRAQMRWEDMGGLDFGRIRLTERAKVALKRHSGLILAPQQKLPGENAEVLQQGTWNSRTRQLNRRYISELGKNCQRLY